MPMPKMGETKQSYVSRCIPIVMNEGTAKDQQQAAGVCYTMWSDHKAVKKIHQELSGDQEIKKTLNNTELGLASWILANSKADSYGNHSIFKSIIPTMEDVQKSATSFGSIEKPGVVSNIPGLTEKQTEIHQQLYQGYQDRVKNAWKEQSWADDYDLMGAIWHTLLFEQFIGTGKPTQQLLKLIERDFGSMRGLLDQVHGVCKYTTGWIVLSYSLEYGCLHIDTLQSHDSYYCSRCIPLMIIDVYEHSYLFDYGIDKVAFIEHLWNSINWVVVSERLSNIVTAQEDNDMYSIAKSQEDEQLVFGWANVAINANGTIPFDWQGDVKTPETLEKAAYGFVIKYRQTGEEHQGEAFGELVESIMFTKQKMEAMGIPEGTVPEGWWVGFHIPDKEVFEKIKKGQYKMFSIDGKAKRTKI